MDRGGGALEAIVGSRLRGDAACGRVAGASAFELDSTQPWWSASVVAPSPQRGDTKHHACQHVTPQSHLGLWSRTLPAAPMAATEPKEPASRESSDGQWWCESCCARRAALVLTICEDVECRCGTTWSPHSFLMCELKCPDMYWTVGQPRQTRDGKQVVSVGIEDECGGCGEPLIFDAEFVVQTVEEVETEEREQDVEE